MGPMMLKALVFDMDDTLYPECTYVESGFRAVAAWLETEASLPAEETLAFIHEVQSGQRGAVFDALLATRPSLAGRFTVADLVQVYRNHRPNIRLYPGMERLLDEVKARAMPIGLISDGFLEAQTRKAEALGVARWADPILLTDAWGRDFWKPHQRAFRQMEATFGLNGAAVAYIADNPAKDFIAPNQMGWITVQVEHPGQVHATPEPPSVQAIATHRVQGVEALRRFLWNPLLSSQA
ncbi:HAD family hydrolase [Geothrix paludis]|uniref:HAD family hydrolase n=1 Tax=Geothrix paludis TaxID=2922722 RepID=UPI001FACCF8C|nr:HAD family hydrolase [Geothrix paludis]